MKTYEEFLETKRVICEPSGFNVHVDDLNPMLFDFQKIITRWSIARGKSAIFLDCGMGKTPIQLEWAHHITERENRPVLIVAPLAVSLQTKREGEKFGVNVNVCRNQDQVIDGVNITNYEMLKNFNAESFAGIVLDESSILKNPFGVTKSELIQFGSVIPYRLCCTATPAPNDLDELTRHSEFLGVMTELEVKGLFFIQDGNSSNKFRLKNHAKDEFWKWIAQWAIAARKPSDLGFEDGAFLLPSLNVHQETVPVEPLETGLLFAVEALTLTEQRRANKASEDDRVNLAAEIANKEPDQVLVWCNTNSESDKLRKAIDGAVEVKGSDSIEHKEDAMEGFTQGRYRVLVTKPSIAGFGMNWQHCGTAIFVGLSHSFERYYQAVRRNWRFGRTEEVNAYIITSEADGAIVKNIERKQSQMIEMFEEVVKHMNPYQDLGRMAIKDEMVYETDKATGEGWQLYLGDCVEQIDNVESDSVGLSVFSPPFPGMYVYSNSAHDMGNVKSIQEMVDQFSFLMSPEKMLRVLMPGRSVFIHITQAVAQKQRDGYMGMKDFRGPLIAMMEDNGWHYYGEITIDKNPQLKATRTKDHGLMFKSLASDSAKMHVAMPDIVLQFRKPGENPVPIKAGISEKYGNPDGWISSEEWINWARPVWYASDYMPGTWKEGYTGDPCPDGIAEGDVISNFRHARETDDERHLCPLQLGVIERIVKLWSAPGETVLSPFAGVGSEGHVSILNNRKFIGMELKKSYWNQAIKNLRNAEIDYKSQNLTLFDLAGVE